jgi:two-component system NtrC family sensor kinase
VSFLNDSWRRLATFVTMARTLRANMTAGRENADLITAFDSTLDRLDPDYLLLEVPQAISQAQDGLQRVSKIVSAMRDFSHKGSGDRRSFPI